MQAGRPQGPPADSSGTCAGSALCSPPCPVPQTQTPCDINAKEPPPPRCGRRPAPAPGRAVREPHHHVSSASRTRPPGASAPGSPGQGPGMGPSEPTQGPSQNGALPIATGCCRARCQRAHHRVEASDNEAQGGATLDCVSAHLGGTGVGEWLSPPLSPSPALRSPNPFRHGHCFLHGAAEGGDLHTPGRSPAFTELNRPLNSHSRKNRSPCSSGGRVTGKVTSLRGLDANVSNIKGDTDYTGT